MPIGKSFVACPVTWLEACDALPRINACLDLASWKFGLGELDIGSIRCGHGASVNVDVCLEWLECLRSSTQTR